MQNWILLKFVYKPEAMKIGRLCVTGLSKKREVISVFRLWWLPISQVVFFLTSLRASSEGVQIQAQKKRVTYLLVSD